MDQILRTIESNAFAMAGVILLGSLLAAFLINEITCRILLRLTSKTKTDLDDQIVRAMRKPLFVTVLLIGTTLALERLELGETMAYISQATLVTLAVLLWAAAAKKVCRAVLSTLVRRASEHQLVQPGSLPLFDIVAKTIVYGGAVYGIFLAWEIDVTAWLASAGILGIAIGFAAKDTLANLFSGIFILADAPYKIGDFIILDSGERGRVTDIGVRTTRLLTRDDIQIILPNAAIANAKIINETGGPHKKERVRVKVGVAYGSDIDQVRRILLEVAENSKHLADDPAPRVRFRQFGESSLDFQLLGWIDEPVLRGRALDELNTDVYHRFQAENISIPFPQRDVHFKNSPPS